MADEYTTAPAKKSKNTKWIIFIALALLLGGVLGYTYGKNSTESDLKAKYSAQVNKLEDDLDDAKQTASGTVEEGQQTMESLQAENESLQSTVDAQTKKIADLEKQLADAQKPTPSPTPTPTPTPGQ